MKMIQAGPVLVPAIFGLLSLAAAQENVPAAEASSVAERLEMTFQGGRLSARIRNCTLQRIAEQLTLKTRVTILPAGEIAADRLSADLRDVALDTALRQLLASYDLFFYYGGPAGNVPASVRKVWVYPSGQAAQLRPVPPAEWASTKELEAILADSDPELRAQAYEALMSSPDPARRDLVLQALRGVGEERDEVRERILSIALSKGLSLPAELLGDLAQTDRSEQIRWMALDALSHDPIGKRIAEQAMTDASQVIREKAKEILAETEPASGDTGDAASESEVQR